jgi:hypothetical protein
MTSTKMLIYSLCMEGFVRHRCNPYVEVGPGHDIKRPTRRLTTTLTPSRYHHKEDGFRTILSTLRKRSHTAVVVSCTRTPTCCDTGPSLQPGLLYTHLNLSTRLMTNDAYYLESGIST